MILHVTRNPHVQRQRLLSRIVHRLGITGLRVRRLRVRGLRVRGLRLNRLNLGKSRLRLSLGLSLDKERLVVVVVRIHRDRKQMTSDEWNTLHPVRNPAVIANERNRSIIQKEVATQ